MVKKIISVDLNFPEKETTQTIETAPEVEDQKDEYAEVKEDANIIEAPTPEPPKPKRKAAAKKPDTAFASAPAEAIAEVEVETEPVKEAPVETTQPKSEDTQKVKCQHCNKEMTLKSLKYSHSKNCLGLKKTIEKVSNEKVSQKTASAPPPPAISPPPSPIPYTNIPVKIKQQQPAYNFPSSEQPTEHPRVARMKVLKEKYNNLVQNAFNV